jgi:hypothetical protein
MAIKQLERERVVIYMLQYSGDGTVTFELITPKDLYNTNNEFLLKVK